MSARRGKAARAPLLPWAMGGLLLGLLSLLGHAHAEPAAETISIRFAAPRGCPDEAAFTRQIQARTARARIAAPDEPARTFEVVIAETGDTGGPTHHGRLQTRELHGATSVRKISGRTCAEVTSALALIVALAIDPKATTAPDVPTPAPPDTSGTVARTDPPPSSGQVGPAPPPPSTPTPPREEPWPLADPLPVLFSAAPLPPEPGLELSAGLGLTAMGGIAPAMTPALLFFVDLAWVRDGPRPLLTIDPSGRLSGASATSAAIPLGDDVATLRWNALRADACPLSVGSEDLSARPCVTLAFGALEGFGDRTRPLLWLDAGALLRLEWRPLGLVSLEISASAIAPLARPAFYFGPGRLLYEVPALASSLGVGLAVPLR